MSASTPSTPADAPAVLERTLELDAAEAGADGSSVPVRSATPAAGTLDTRPEAASLTLQAMLVEADRRVFPDAPALDYPLTLSEHRAASLVPVALWREAEDIEAALHRHFEEDSTTSDWSIPASDLAAVPEAPVWAVADDPTRALACNPDAALPVPGDKARAASTSVEAMASPVAARGHALAAPSVPQVHGPGRTAAPALPSATPVSMSATPLPALPSCAELEALLQAGSYFAVLRVAPDASDAAVQQACCERRRDACRLYQAHAPHSTMRQLAHAWLVLIEEAELYLRQAKLRHAYRRAQDARHRPSPPGEHGSLPL